MGGAAIMDIFIIVFIFIAIAYASWRKNYYLAYMMAAFIGVGNLLYMVGNGLGKEVWYIWAGVAGLLIVGYLRDPEKPK
jgi:hypothetical protein